MSEQPQDGNGASSGREKLRADGGRRDSDEDESETDGPRDDREISPDKDRQDQGQRREQDQPRQGNQPPRRQQPQRGPGGGSDRFSRRQVLGGAAVAAVGGWFVFLRDSGGGPGGVVKSYYNAVSNGDFERAESLVHAESPARGDTPYGEINPDELDISVENVEPLNESEAGFSYNATNYATVQEFEILEVSITTSNSGEAPGQEVAETATITRIVAKNADGEWKLWDTAR